MTALPALRVRVVVKGLKKFDFEKVRQKGSHAIFHHSDCRRAVLPVHPNSEGKTSVRLKRTRQVPELIFNLALANGLKEIFAEANIPCYITGELFGQWRGFLPHFADHAPTSNDHIYL